MKLILVDIIVLLISSVLGSRIPETIKCGRLGGTPSLRIIGGHTVTTRNKWPWMVSIFTGNINDFERNGRRAHSCGGVLINREWVITAAHCIDYKNDSNVFPLRPPQDWRVTAGMVSRYINSSDTIWWQTRRVSRMFYDGNFQDLTVSAQNDIAILRLSSPVEFNNYVRPICLPNRNTITPGEQVCYVTGWGVTSESSEVYSLSLREVVVPVLNHTLCKARYGTHYNPRQHWCAGDWVKGGIDSCKGDSGGPLACRAPDGNWFVAGIVSWGSGCGRPFRPGVYTKVSFYNEWLNVLLKIFSREIPQLLRNGRVRVQRSVKSSSSSIMK